MNFKRTVGTGKIFLYSCGIIIAAAAAVWLIINGVYAVYILHKEPEYLPIMHTSPDIITPWLLMTASAVIYYRYWKMCSASNVSCTKQTLVFSLLSAIVPTVFAAADLLTVKFVMQPLYKGIIYTDFEDKSPLPKKYIYDFICALAAGEADISSMYTMKMLLLIFTFMAVHYYCFFLTGCYIMQCFRYGRKKQLIYYAVITAILILTAFAFDKLDLAFEDSAIALIMSFILYAVIILGFFTNPFIFLYFIPYLSESNGDSVTRECVFMTAFILITVASIEVLGLIQTPKNKSEKRLKAAAKNSRGNGGSLNDRRT